MSGELSQGQQYNHASVVIKLKSADLCRAYYPFWLPEKPAVPGQRLNGQTVALVFRIKSSLCSDPNI